jgi:hypothetical protein
LPGSGSSLRSFAFVGAATAGVLALLAIIWALLMPLPLIAMGLPLSGCRKCDLEEIARRESDGGAACGWRMAYETQYVVDCALSAQRAGRSFWMVEWLPGIDSRVAAAFIRQEDGGLNRLMYDSDTSGQYRPCAATVVRQRCTSPLTLRPGTNLADCETEAVRERLCTEVPR